MQSKCSLLASANFDDGDDGTSIPITILDRFDLIFKIKDDEDRDAEIARAVVNNNMRRSKVNQNDTLLLQKYIKFAK